MLRAASLHRVWWACEQALSAKEGRCWKVKLPPKTGESNTMLIKSADDKTKRLALLEDLQKSLLLDMRQKEWLRDELCHPIRPKSAPRA